MKVFVTGTDTDVGKTEVSQFLLKTAMSQGMDVLAIKPIETGVETLKHEGIKTDLERLSESTNGRACGLRQFNIPASPWQAARVENKTVDPKTLVGSILEKAENSEFVLVEGAGGWRVPITEDYFVSDLACDLGWPVLLVSSDKIGTINHTLLSCESINKKVAKIGVVINERAPSTDVSGSSEQLKILIKTNIWSYSRGSENKEFWKAFLTWAI